MSPFGIMLSFIAPFMFIDPSNPSKSHIKLQIAEYFTFHTALAVFLFAASVLFFHENPHADAMNKGDDEDEEEAKIPIGQILRNLFTDVKYIFLLFTFAFANGSLAGISAILSPVMAIWGLGEVRLKSNFQRNSEVHVPLSVSPQG